MGEVCGKRTGHWVRCFGQCSCLHCDAGGCVTMSWCRDWLLVDSCVANGSNCVGKCNTPGVLRPLGLYVWRSSPNHFPLSKKIALFWFHVFFSLSCQASFPDSLTLWRLKTQHGAQKPMHTPQEACAQSGWCWWKTPGFRNKIDLRVRQTMQSHSKARTLTPCGTSENLDSFSLAVEIRTEWCQTSDSNSLLCYINWVIRSDKEVPTAVLNWQKEISDRQESTENVIWCMGAISTNVRHGCVGFHSKTSPQRKMKINWREEWTRATCDVTFRSVDSNFHVFHPMLQKPRFFLFS